MVNQTVKTVEELKLLEQPLIVQEELHMDHNLIQKLKNYSAWIGICFGVFVQLSTLGVNFLMIAIWGEDSVLTQTQQQAMVFSLSWSLFTSCLALLVLSMLRGLIKSILDVNRSDDIDREGLMMTIEVRYVIGALTGVCLAWTCTDLMLGMESLAFYSLGTLVVALLWSKTMIWCFLARDGLEREKEEETRQGLVSLV